MTETKIHLSPRKLSERWGFHVESCRRVAREGRLPFRGGQNGDQKGGHFSEHYFANGADVRATTTANEGRTRGGHGATNSEGQNGKEEQNNTCVEAEAIFEAYPRRQAKTEGLKAIRTALNTCPADRLLEQTRAYAEATSRWPEADKKFIPHPATWFNRGSFDDDPGTWTRKGPKTLSPEFQKF